MAIEKQIETEHGAICEYWKIKEISISDSVGVQLDGYISESMRFSGKHPIKSLVFKFEKNQIEEAPVFEALYGLIKLESMFDGAADV